MRCFTLLLLLSPSSASSFVLPPTYTTQALRTGSILDTNLDTKKQHKMRHVTTSLPLSIRGGFALPTTSPLQTTLTTGFGLLLLHPILTFLYSNSKSILLNSRPSYLAHTTICVPMQCFTR